MGGNGVWTRQTNTYYLKYTVCDGNNTMDKTSPITGKIIQHTMSVPCSTHPAAQIHIGLGLGAFASQKKLGHTKWVINLRAQQYM